MEILKDFCDSFIDLINAQDVLTAIESDFAFKLAVETRHHSFKTGLKFRRCHILFWKTGCIVKTSGSLSGAKLHVTDLQKAHRRFIKVAPEQPRLFLGTDGTQLIYTLFERSRNHSLQ